MRNVTLGWQGDEGRCVQAGEGREGVLTTPAQEYVQGRKVQNQKEAQWGQRQAKEM